MAGAEIIVFNSKILYCIEHCAELYVLVAHDAWIWCASVPVFRLEIFKDLFPVVCLNINYMVFNSVFLAEFGALADVFFFTWTKAGFLHFDFVAVFVFFNDGAIPKAHGNSDYLATHVLEHEGC